VAAIVEISERFCGPPGIANGGYVAGLLALHRAGTADASEVRLLAGVPLQEPLELLTTESGATLRRVADSQILAEARPAEWSAPPLPPPPELDAIRGRSERCRAFRSHPFPGCFVCGPERSPGDGLAIWPVALEDGRVAAIWEPHESLVDARGEVRPEYVWAALDCTSSFALLEPESADRYVPMVLGTLVARLHSPLRRGETAIVSGWSEGFEGRKGIGGTAVHTTQGRLVGVARAIWISLAGRQANRSSSLSSA